MENGIVVKVVFVQKRNKRSEWLAILCRLYPNKKNHPNSRHSLGY
jgi:hypothetical protein